jgi:glycosyltransferase involved in cell wall biosynthesis
MRGFWVDERVEGGLWNLKNPVYAAVYKYFKGKEKEFIREADAIIVLTDAAKQELLSWNLNTNITIIPCCVDLKQFDRGLFSQNDRNKIRSELGIHSEDYVLLYLGSLGTWYLYQEMTSFFDEVKKQRPNARFLFITQDIDKVETNRDFIVLTVSRDEIPKYIFACDASVCFIKPSFSKKGSSATKMAEVLAMGLPMITNPGWGDVEYLSRNIKSIILYNTDESPDKNLLTLARTTQDTFFYEFFSLEMGIIKYCNVYRILSNPSSR